MYVLNKLNRKRLFSDIILDLVNAARRGKRKIKNYLNNRLKDYEKNTHELKKRYRIVKVFLELR